MSKGCDILIGIAALTIFGTSGIAQDRNRDAGFAAWIKPRLDLVVQRSSELVVERYELEQAATAALSQALREAADSALDDSQKVRTMGTHARVGNNSEVWIDILSLPAGNAALGRYLTDEQVEDYASFTRSRGEREARAVVAQLAAWADRQLSLRPDQRQKVGEVLAAGPGKEWLSSQALVRIDPNEFTNFLPRLQVDPEALNGVLCEAQKRVWRRVIGANDTTSEESRVDLEEREALHRMAREEAGIGKALEPGRITREQALKRLEGLQQQSAATETAHRQARERAQAEDRTRQLIEAKLTAYTEQLGELDARAAKRLALVAKGVAEQYLESLRRSGGEDLIRTRSEAADITHHPLYQQTIKDVLSEEAYAEYQAGQRERAVFWQQAARDVALACLDTRLLLSEPERTRLETISTRLTVESNRPAVAVFAELAGQLDPDDLKEWQRETIDEILQESGWSLKGAPHLRRP